MQVTRGRDSLVSDQSRFLLVRQTQPLVLGLVVYVVAVQFTGDFLERVFPDARVQSDVHYGQGFVLVQEFEESFGGVLGKTALL